MGLNEKVPPQLAYQGGKTLVTITTWPTADGTQNIHVIEAWGFGPKMYVGEDGIGRFVRIHKGSSTPTRYVYINKKSYPIFLDTVESIIEGYAEAVHSLPIHLKGVR